MSIQEKRARMLSLVDDWRSSGLTQQSFCLAHDIKVATLQYLVARAKAHSISTLGFTEISSGSAESRSVEIIYPNGIRIKADADLGLLSQLIRLY